jgi:hypothetical protein
MSATPSAVCISNTSMHTITPSNATVNGPSQCQSAGPIKITKPAKTAANKLAAKKTRRTKKWKRPKDKPSRPLSAYNFFFQSERALLLGADAPSDEEEMIKKRVHCKTHGKIGFADMARMIGGRWKALESKKRIVFEDQAKRAKDRYAAELAVWKEGQQDKSDDESSKGSVDSNHGLDVMASAATAAMVCDHMESEQFFRSPAIEGRSSDELKFILADELQRRKIEEFPRGPAAIEARSSDELKFLLADELQRRKIRLAQQSQESTMLEYLWALREQRQMEAAFLGGSHMDSSLVEYPTTSAAEAASANAILQQFQSGQIYSPEQISLQTASSWPSQRYIPMAATMHHNVQNRFMANEYAFPGGADKF